MTVQDKSIDYIDINQYPSSLNLKILIELVQNSNIKNKKTIIRRMGTT